MSSKNIVLKGATWNGVESIDLPVSGGGTARFVETSDSDAVASDVAQGKTCYVNGSKITGTASGGGGGAYAWLGDGAEKVGTIINRTINLKDDTGYDDWTASTTATTLIAADTDPYYTYSADVEHYDYCFVTKGYIEPVYVAGTPSTYRTIRACQYFVTYYYGYYSNSNTADLQSGNPNQTSSFNPSTNLYIQYYYNNAGIATARTSTQCGPLYMSTYPTVQASTSLSSGIASVVYKFPTFLAKCDANRFTTERKEQVDSANTNYIVTVDVYRVPHGKSLMSYWVEEMRDALNAV